MSHLAVAEESKDGSLELPPMAIVHHEVVGEAQQVTKLMLEDAHQRSQSGVAVVSTDRDRVDDEELLRLVAIVHRVMNHGIDGEGPLRHAKSDRPEGQRDLMRLPVAREVSCTSVVDRHMILDGHNGELEQATVILEHSRYQVLKKHPVVQPEHDLQVFGRELLEVVVAADDVHELEHDLLSQKGDIEGRPAVARDQLGQRENGVLWLLFVVIER